MLELTLMSGNFQGVLWPVLFRMAVSFLCGAIVGTEREWRGKAAGFRTNILICLGATLFTVGSEFAAKYVAGAPQESTRITAQIVTGVGFLGAGAILRSGRGVEGLTTAATIWLVAAIGVLVGLGFPVIGLVAAVMTVTTLVVLGRIEKRIMGPCEMRTLEMHLGPNRPVTLARLQAVLETAPWPTRVDRVHTDDEGTSVTFTYCSSHAHHRGILWELGQLLE